MPREQSPRQLLVIILNEPDKLQDLLQKLYDVNIPGATILSSVGGFGATSWLEDIGLHGIARMFQNKELEQRVILSVMDSEMIEVAIAAAEQVVGGFGRPDSGMLFTVPLDYTVGLINRPMPEAASAPIVSETDVQIRDMPVAQAAQLIEGDVVKVRSNASLLDIVAALTKSPSAHVAAVVSREDHLLGLVKLSDLADRVFIGIIPELFLGEIFDRGRAEEFGSMTTVRSASDFMSEPISVHADDPVREAFRLMHEHDLAGLPIVDDSNRVIDFVSLLELLELVLKEEGNNHE